jgi:putative oxidoreductase
MEERMNAVVSQYGSVVGRCLIALIFLISGIGKIEGFAGTAGFMASKGLPMVEVLLVLTILIEVGGAVMLIIGWKAKLAATLLFLFLIPVTVVFHPWWADPAQKVMFLKNLAIMGGLLYIMVHGSGSCSVDKR